MRKIILLSALLAFLSSCGEEAITQGTISEEYNASNLEEFSLSTCSQFTFRKPPVDILYVVDNTGSTLSGSFDSIKSEIKNTVSTLSSDFDYHIYVAPLKPAQSDSISGYPVIISDTDSVPSIASLNQVNVNNLSMFAAATGNNTEFGFERVQNLINSNRSNGIFRDEANTIIVMISNGDDSESYKTIGGQLVYDANTFNQIKNEMTTLKSNLSASSFRFISLVPNSACHPGWKEGIHYKKMSEYLYNLQSFSDSVTQDRLDLCSGNYNSLFNAINSSIQAIIEGHKYDHWPISYASSETTIETSDIKVTKINADGSSTVLSPSTSNGFEYIGHKENQKINYAPSDANERVTGLMIKLYGDARVTYPECILAETRTPTEYFGYIALPREPNKSSIKINIDDKEVSESNTDGWSYIGWKDTINIKVPGPSNTAITPEVNKSGYMIKLSGDAIFTNGQQVKVYYKPNSL